MPRVIDFKGPAAKTYRGRDRESQTDREGSELDCNHLQCYYHSATHSPSVASLITTVCLIFLAVSDAASDKVPHTYLAIYLHTCPALPGVEWDEAVFSEMPSGVGKYTLRCRAYPYTRTFCHKRGFLGHRVQIPITSPLIKTVGRNYV